MSTAVNKLVKRSQKSIKWGQMTHSTLSRDLSSRLAELLARSLSCMRVGAHCALFISPVLNFILFSNELRFPPAPPPKGPHPMVPPAPVPMTALPSWYWSNDCALWCWKRFQINLHASNDSIAKNNKPGTAQVGAVSKAQK